MNYLKHSQTLLLLSQVSILLDTTPSDYKKRSLTWTVSKNNVEDFVSYQASKKGELLCLPEYVVLDDINVGLNLNKTVDGSHKHIVVLDSVRKLPNFEKHSADIEIITSISTILGLLPTITKEDSIEWYDADSNCIVEFTGYDFMISALKVTFTQEFALSGLAETLDIELVCFNKIGGNTRY